MGIRETVGSWLVGPQLRELQTDAQAFSRFTKATESMGLTLADLELALDDLSWTRVGSFGVEKIDLEPYQRKTLVQRSRVYYQRDPLVTQAIRLYTDYTFARPLTMKAADDGVQELIERIFDDPTNRHTLGTLQAQRKQSDRLLVDGERFFACFIGASDEPVKVRGIDCLQIEEIVTDPEDAESIWGYKRIWMPPGGQPKTQFYADWDAREEAIEALEKRAAEQQGTFENPEEVRVSHLVINTIGQRGLPLCVAGLDWAQAHRKFMEDRATITRARAAFAYKKKVKGGPAQLAAMKAPFNTDPRTMANPPPGAGSTWLENEGVDLQPFQMPQDARNALEDARNLKLLFCAATGIAEPFFGNADNSNLATSKTLLRPMELMFSAYQLLWLDWYEDLIAHCIDWTGMSVADDKRAIDIDAPPIVEQDVNMLGQALVNLLTVFPQLADVDDVLQYALTIIGVNNIDDIMAGIQRQRQAGPPRSDGADALQGALESVLLEMRGRALARANGHG